MNATGLLAATLAGTQGKPFQLACGAKVRWLGVGAVLVEPQAPLRKDVLLSAGIHGNETAPIELLDRLFERVMAGRVVVRQRLLFVLGNPPAMEQGTRYIDYDMNRLFNGRHADHSSLEALRAEQLEGFAQAFFQSDVRLHYDLHTAIRGSRIERFALYPWAEGRVPSDVEMRRLAEAGIEALLLHSEAGNTYAAYTFGALGADSFTLELGKARPFGCNAALDLTALENSFEALLQGQEPTARARPDRYRVERSIIRKSAAFRLSLASDAENFTELPVGYLVAEDGDTQWVVRTQGTHVLFPNPNVAIGLRAGLLVVPE
ncbi:succinylglutamate desuccinylase [Pseudomonas matsuisoli]|uniref:Succinylglutamate desuccinylase n=1 Tax=Pseudomonas matsuisoli TaxID=1515666 RepID=A0A917UU75_9PSED|nr:succinylglutamate desuccinylase [Pseudomonas matsuisoli]GGJ85448.1 succinylglutamate desuccinylase [Pseudomonas matsuisoli]